MNLNQFVNMVSRMVMRRALRSGMNAGMRTVTRQSRRLAKQKPPLQITDQRAGEPATEQAGETPEQRAERLDARRAVREPRGAIRSKGLTPERKTPRPKGRGAELRAFG